MHSPMAQFEIHDISPVLFNIGDHAIAFTNSTLYMFLAILFAGSFVKLSMRKRAVVPGRWQMACELIYNFVAELAFSNSGKKAQPFIPLFLSLFLYILFCNLLGLVPSSLTVTAHPVVNVGLALTLFAVIMGTGFKLHGVHFLKLFVPSDVPMWLAPFITFIEFLSFWVRPCSLTIRLFANMLAGHILLKIVAGMAATVGTAGWAATSAIFPVLLNVGVLMFELLVAFLQAYIFTILSTVYMRDALEMH